MKILYLYFSLQKGGKNIVILLYSSEVECSKPNHIITRNVKNVHVLQCFANSNYILRYSKHIANFLSILSCWLHCVVVIMVILDILTIIHIFSIRLDLIINCRWVFCVLYLGVVSLYNLYRTALNWYYYDYSLHFANTWLLFFFPSSK